MTEIRMLQILPLRLKLRSETLSLHEPAGTLWHSGVGVSLKRHFPVAFEQLFAEHGKEARLYALRPATTPVRRGADFELGVTLFGPATRHAIAITQAIAELGRVGLGDSRARFSLVSAHVGSGAGTPFHTHDHGLTSWPEPLSAAQWLEAIEPNINRATIELTTPVAIKSRNALHFGPVSCEQLVRRMLGRVNQICTSADQDTPFDTHQAENLIAVAKQTALKHSALKWHSVKRRSARSGHTMTFGGMTGTLEYEGAIAPLAGLLRLAEPLQLGAKTAFGFGCIQTTFH